MEKLKTRDGGLAFPCGIPAGKYHPVLVINGMSMLDWYAGMAMQGLLAASEGYSDADLVEASYRAAAKMIEYRDTRIDTDSGM